MTLARPFEGASSLSCRLPGWAGNQPVKNCLPQGRQNIRRYKNVPRFSPPGAVFMLVGGAVLSELETELDYLRRATSIWRSQVPVAHPTHPNSAVTAAKIKRGERYSDSKGQAQGLCPISP
jgi:hypothetical protein